MNLAELFLSGKLFPPFLLVAGITALLFGHSKKFYKQAAANHGEEHAIQATKKLRRGGPIMIAGSLFLFIIEMLR
jgi:hypothetical protein